MRGRNISLIARKELLETLRDRRTLFVALVLPLLLYPALLLGLTQVLGATQRDLDEERQRVLLYPAEPALVAALRRHRLEPEDRSEEGERLRTRLGELAAAGDEARAESI
ncbi:MAG: hypothetical protein ACREID_04705, partial [Planctomycetota bacterium]